jgi:hypothetical protein
MTGDDLTPGQLAWFQAIVGRHPCFYGRLRTRMERRRFRGDDRLYRVVYRALDAVNVLNAELYHLGRPEGLGTGGLSWSCWRPGCRRGFAPLPDAPGDA